MNKQIWTLTCLFCLAGVSSLAERLPNIVIIYADDVGYGDIGCYGATAVDTPAIDQLAVNGIRFTSAYATASTCTPSRYSLLTGRYAFRNKNAVILPGNAPLIIDITQSTLPSVLREQGYSTGLVGKWHIGLGNPTEPLDWNELIAPGPKEVGFDYSYHMAATGDRVPSVFIENGRIVGLDSSDPVTVNYLEAVGDDPTGISHPEMLKTQADEQHAKTIVDGTSRIGWMSGGEDARWTDEEMPDVFLNKAIEFVEENKEEPFFLFYAMHENHVPRIPHPRFRGSSSLGVRGDAVVQMDWSIGRLMETLKENGLSENTIVIFSSDNGPVLYDGYYDGARELNGDHKPAGPWRGGKYSVWEGGTRMPFILSWPGTVEPGLSDALISQVDLLASLAALTGAELPQEEALDSQNLSDALFGKSEDGRDYLIQQGVKMEAIRKGPWKYIPEGDVTNRGSIGKFYTNTITPPGALFYLPEDPGEANDVARIYPAKVQELRALLDAEVGDNTARQSDREELGGAVRN
ncbi:arylsulfatase [Puniceicoccales bacterium CK1056]|uniref:Arylsulfatase n=1 Tax=Oceanipulchritudo coccoides TaxID=2706888 RepID=A0A6B2M042_9BACT|nr:arylsulfatase [Oceanipulchritudo coccoides]NDV61544.1 arylsulfatase [Oceanipulchritudo coccoides]